MNAKLLKSFTLGLPAEETRHVNCSHKSKKKKETACAQKSEMYVKWWEGILWLAHIGCSHEWGVEALEFFLVGDFANGTSAGGCSINTRPEIVSVGGLSSLILTVDNGQNSLIVSQIVGLS